MACQDSITLTLNATKGVNGQLKRLLSTGLYGTTVEECAERVLAQTLIEKKEKMIEDISRFRDPRLLINLNPE